MSNIQPAASNIATDFTRTPVDRAAAERSRIGGQPLTQGTPQAGPGRGTDSVNLSSQALSAALRIDTESGDRVLAAREAIADGTLDSDAKLDAALDRMINSILS